MPSYTASDGSVFQDRGEYRKYEFELSFTFRNKHVEKLIKSPGSIEGQPFDISDLDECEVLLLDHSDQVQIDNVKNSRVLISASSESVFVRDCNDCSFSIACKQLRTRDCHNCTFYLYSKTEPIIELSDAITFAPFNVAYPQHQDHVRLANLDPEANLWSLVFDFNDEQRTGCHWRIRKDEVEGPLPIWYPLGEICEMAIPIVSSSPPPTGAGALPLSKDNGMTMYGLDTMQADAHQRKLEEETAKGGEQPQQQQPKKKKSAIGWNPDRSELPLDTAPPAQPPAAQKKKSAVGWNPPVEEEQEKPIVPKKSTIGWDPSRLTDVTTVTAEERTPAKDKAETSIAWDERRIAAREEVPAQIGLPVQPSEGLSDLPQMITGDMSSNETSPPTKQQQQRKKEKKHQIGWSEDRLSVTTSAKADEEQIVEKAPLVISNLPPEPKEVTTSLPPPPPRPQLPIELQGLLLYARERGVNLMKWFQHDQESEEGKSLSSIPTAARNDMLIPKDDFVTKLEGLAKGLCAGNKHQDVIDKVAGALAPPFIDEAMKACGCLTGQDTIDIQLLLSYILAAERSMGLAHQGKAGSQRSKGFRYNVTVPKPKSTVPKLFSKLEPKLKDKIKAVLHSAQHLHAFKIRLGTLSNPLLTPELILAFEAVGLRLKKVEAQVLIWSCRSLAEQSLIKGVPLRLRKSELMHYVLSLRDEKSIDYKKWASSHAHERAQKQQAIDKEFQKALEGHPYRLSTEDLEACLRSTAKAGIIPKAMLEIEIEGRAHDTAHSNDGVYDENKVQDEKDRLRQAEDNKKAVSYTLLSRYLKEGGLRHTGDTIPLTSWLEKRMSGWTARRVVFNEWLQAKLEKMSMEREQKARKTAAMVQSVGISTIKQGKEIIDKFANVLVEPQPPAEKQGKKDKKGSKIKPTEKEKTSLLVESCFDRVLHTLEKSPAKPPRATNIATTKECRDINNMDLVESAEYVIDQAHEAVVQRRALAENDFQAWKDKKAKEDRLKKKQAKLDKKKIIEEKEARNKAAQASYRRWLRLQKRHKYFSVEAGASKERPIVTKKSKKGSLPPWVDILATAEEQSSEGPST